MRYFAGLLLSAFLGALAANWLSAPQELRISAQEPRGPALERNQPRQPGRAAPLADPSLFTADGLSIEEAINVSVYERVNRSVVNITTRSVRNDNFFLLEVPSEGNGSGSVLDMSGHVLTNFHVIGDAREVAVTLWNGRTYDATVVGHDAVNDIAVLKIDAPRDELYPVIVGDSARLRVGMRVFALGNPFGLERTLTTGIISSLNRSLQIHTRTIKQIIQIDAAINPGSSGGPLLDSHGRLIGMNTAIATRTGQSAGVGFAIPANLITRVVPQLIAHGRVIRAEIGIQRVYETDQGLLIARLSPDGPAERAGLQGPRVIQQRRGPLVIQRTDRTAADRIIAVDGEKVTSAEDFLEMIESRRPGDQVVLTIIRENRRVDVPVTLGGEPVRNRD